MERMIEALHMELLFVRHRIAVKLANLGQGTRIQSRSPTRLVTMLAGVIHEQIST